MRRSSFSGRKQCFSVARLAAVTFVVCATLASAQVLRPPAHPNHYIILLDRSGSTVQSVRKENYARVLREVLPALLFDRGLGDGIPAYDPDRDAVTLERFGIIEGNLEANPALVRQGLGKADFLTEYIHPQRVAASGLSRENLQVLFFSPGPHYRFTLLSWCKELGIWSLKRDMEGRLFARTFLIVVDDGQTNGVDAQHEVTEAMRWGDPKKMSHARETVEKISADYKFVPIGSSVQGQESVFPLAIGSGEGRIFIENYEVFPQQLATLEKETAQLRPLDSFSTDWGSGRSDEISLRGELSREFVHWLESHRASEIQMAAQGRSVAFNIVEKKFSLSVGLRRSCGSRQSLPVRLSTPLIYPDPILGNRSLEFNYTQEFIASVPMECTLLWATECSAAGLLALCLTGILIAFFYFRYFTAPLSARLPGHRGWKLKRNGQLLLVNAVSPRSGSPLFEFRLFPYWARKVVCRGARLRIVAADRADSTDGAQWSDGSLSLDLGRFKGDRATAYAARNSLQQVGDIKAVFEQRHQQMVVTFMHSGGEVPMSGDDHTKLNGANSAGQAQKEPGSSEKRGAEETRANPMYFVALDLGSESMAAYYSVVNSEGTRSPVPLQHYAPRLVREGLPWLFAENNETSNRLRTRFDIRGGQEEQLQESLDFVCGGNPDIAQYEKSVFQFFHRLEQPVLNPIPNPKIIFERGAQNAIPDVGDSKPCRPDQLIHWLTAQVVINFVLQAPKLKDVPRKSIVLILTVPNVYSVTHVESLRSFVEKESNVKEVRTVFESDAVAAYAMGDQGQSDFHHQLKQAKKKGPVELVTFDMGRGTTDLSIVQFEGGGQQENLPANAAKARWRHYQKARTGRSDGGNKLTHLFVEYFERTVEAAYKEANVQRPYSFIQLRGALLTNELRWALEGLEQYIHQVKTKLSDDYSLNGRDYKTILKARDVLVTNILTQFRSPATTGGDTQAGGTDPIDSQIKKLLDQALTMPRDLRLGMLRKVFGKWWRKRDGFQQAISKARRQLSTELGHYTNDNVTALIGDLRTMADQYESAANQTPVSESGAARKLGQKSIPRFAVIAGQAAHFRPVKKAIREALNDLQISEEAIYFVPGSQAKECCCQGAAAFYANYIDAVNEDHLHGTFAIIEDFAGMDPITVPVQQLIQKPWERSLPRETLYSLCFSPKPYFNEAELDSDNWAILYKFRDDKVVLHYDRTARQLNINGSPVTLHPYGIRREKEFYARLWPERLLPASVRIKNDAGDSAGV